MSLNIQGVVTGLNVGSYTVGPFTIATNASGNTATTALTLASGANTITVPSWASCCIIAPNSSNAVALTLKGVSGDTGIPLDLTAPSLVNFPGTPPASFVVTAGSTAATVTEFIFL